MGRMRMDKRYALQEGDALVIVDMQNCFLPGGTLGINGSDRIIPPVNRTIEAFAKREFPIALSRDWHPPGHISFAEQGGPWPVHGVAGTVDAAFSPELIIPGGAVVFSKATDRDHEEYSAFLAKTENGMTLRSWLGENAVQRIWIGGLATDYCVLNTALDMLRAGYRVMVLIDAVFAVDVKDGDGERAIVEMAARGAEMVTTGQIEA